MKTNTKKVKEAQGAEPTIEQVKEWLYKDLQLALSCLTVLTNDPDSLHVLATYLHGRHLNMLNAQKNQTSMFPGKELSEIV